MWHWSSYSAHRSCPDADYLQHLLHLGVRQLAQAVLPHARGGPGLLRAGTEGGGQQLISTPRLLLQQPGGDLLQPPARYPLLPASPLRQPRRTGTLQRVRQPHHHCNISDARSGRLWSVSCDLGDRSSVVIVAKRHVSRKCKVEFVNLLWRHRPALTLGQIAFCEPCIEII